MTDLMGALDKKPGTGYLEESPGVKSSTRLLALLLVCGCLGLAMAATIAALRKDSATIVALGAPIGALAAGAWGALRERREGGGSGETP